MRIAIMTVAAAMGLALSAQAFPALAASDTAPLVTVSLEEQPALADDVDALPRLVGDRPAIAAINAELERLDAHASSELAHCQDGEWSRWVTNPMIGPGYLTLHVHSDISCGGPYPSSGQTAITWDVTTGERLDWPSALPGLSLTAETFDDMPEDYVPNVSSAALTSWYSRTLLASADPEVVGECADVWSMDALNGASFKIWLDAEIGGVAVAPDFPHAIQACAETATLDASDMQGLGAPAALIDAVTAAHAAGAWAPKYED